MFVRTPLSFLARVAVVSAAALMVSGAAMAQSTKHVSRHETNAARQARIDRTINDTYAHRWEVFGGGGFLRFRPGATLQRDTQVSWAVTTNYFLNPKLFVLGSAQGSFGYAKVPTNSFGVYNPQINEYLFQGGAGYRFYRKEKMSLSVQGVGGVGDGIFSGGAKGLYGYELGVWQDGLKPAFQGSVNADINIYPNLAFRVAPYYQETMFNNTVYTSYFCTATTQPACSPVNTTITSTTTNNATQGHFGMNLGIVYRFGHQ